MDMMTFETPNLAQYEQMLLQMGTMPARGLGRKAVRQGANVIRDEARLMAPRLTGLLRRSIYTKDRGIDGANIVFSISVRMTKGWAFYASWVEFGTINAQPHPFMRPAVDAKKEQAIAVLGATLGAGLTEAWGITV